MAQYTTDTDLYVIVFDLCILLFTTDPFMIQRTKYETGSLLRHSERAARDPDSTNYMRWPSVIPPRFPLPVEPGTGFTEMTEHIAFVRTAHATLQSPIRIPQSAILPFRRP
jgi:hypothetical protein